ncbi:uncharacterized protein BJ212DRAFT_502213 [Suillus subaureus]|uniref:Uncharacterized protein n=1 Tax=Suillus subaureus TaxID=48587 RepID=A0A9P7DJS3_9AGAM|nr:uncharacterized protein BJ212DRAFT_502213 [Suillus subaureus]KAG1796128.1 hypothetical protein BJ212DRAFT_502213 [Suillus subaureus]
MLCTSLNELNVPHSNPHIQPPAEELAEMTVRTEEVVRLPEAHRNDTPIFPLPSSPLRIHIHFHALVSVHPHSHNLSSSLGMSIMVIDAPDRAPKRPWEGVEDQDRSMAETDTELIKAKRVLTTEYLKGNRS